MKNILITTMGILFLFCACTSQKTRPFIEHHAFYNGATYGHYNKGFEVGHQEGHTEGYETGHQNGITEAKTKWYQQGTHDGYMNAIKAAENRKVDVRPDMIAQAYLESYHEYCKDGGALSIIKCIEAKIKADLKEHRDTMPWYNRGFQNGRHSILDSLYEPLAVMKRHIVYPNPPSDDNVFIDYDSSVVLKIREIALNKYNYPVQNVGIFSSALKEIHRGMLKYVAHRVNLTASESALMLSEYDKIHDDLTTIYYKYFMRIIESENIDMQKNGFYSFKLYHNVNAFVEVVNAGACSVVDLIFTYVKKNALYSSVKGLDNLGEGHICQILMEEVLRKFRVHTERIALGYDYETVKPEIEISLRQSLVNSVVESRTIAYPKPIVEKFKAKDGSDVTVTMELYAFVGLGLQQQAITLGHTLSPSSSNLVVQISDEAYLLPQFIHVGYKIVSTEVTMEYKTQINKTTNQYSIWSLPKEGISTSSTKVVTAQKTVSVDEYEKIFQAHKHLLSYDNIAVLLKNTRLNKSCVQIFRGTVLKVLEPAMSLPTCRYKALLNFGSSEEILLNLIRD